MQLYIPLFNKSRNIYTLPLRNKYTIAKQTFEDFAQIYELPGLHTNKTGIAVFLKPTIQSRLLFQQRLTLQHSTTEFIALQINNYLCIFIYTSPITTPTIFKEQLSNIINNAINQLQWNGPIFCCCDFN